MPAALISPAIAAVTGLTGTSLSVATGVTQLALVTGLSLVAGALAPKPELEDPANGQLETQQPVPSRTFVYGRMEVSGSVGLKKKVAGEDTPSLTKIVLVHDGELDFWETIYGDDRLCLLGTDNFVVNGPYHQAGVDRLQLWLHNGAANQVADAELIAKQPTIWTSAHRLRGIAYAFIHPHGVDSDNYMQSYPQGEPDFKFVIRGRRLWDPRDLASDPGDPTTWLWSDNPALCILDWCCKHPKGYASLGVTSAKLDLASFKDMADLCDELIPLTTGGSEKRYRVAMEVNLKEQSRSDVLSRLRLSCDAHLYKTGSGSWAIRGGKWTAPTVTLDAGEGHIVEAEMLDGVEATSRFNEYEISYLEPNNHYASNECDPWQMVADTEFAAGKIRTGSQNLAQVPSFTQARRLAKIYASYANPKWIGTIQTNFYGLNVIGERNINLVWSEPEESGAEIDGPYWLEQSMQLRDDGTGMQLSVRSCDPTAYDWDPETETGTVPRILPPSDIEFTPDVEPSLPVDFDAVEDPGGGRWVDLSWTLGAEKRFYIARVWRSATSSFDDAIEVSGPRYRERKSDTATLMTFRDPVPAGDWCYFLTVENPVGLRNATPAGPVCVTISATATPIDDNDDELIDDDANTLTIEAA